MKVERTFPLRYVTSLFVLLMNSATAAWVIPQSTSTVQTTSTPFHTMNGKRPQGPALSYAVEPAGVVLLFSRPISIRATVSKGRKRAKRFIENRSIYQTIRRINKGETLLDNESHFLANDALEQTLSIPSWAFHNELEKYHLAAMKALLKQDLQALEGSFVELQNGTTMCVQQAFPDVYGDFRLLRFLRKDRLQNPTSAANRYRAFLQWRAEHNVDQVRSWVETHPFAPPQFLNHLLGERLPCEFHIPQQNEQDTMPAFLHVGKWDTASITDLIRSEKLSLADFLHYWIHTFESIHSNLHKESMKQQKMIYIDEVCDLGGMSLRQFSPGFVSLVLKPWITLTQTNYPETTKRIIFLNPPRIISLVWNLVAPMASPGTLAKVQLHRGFHGSCHDFVRGSQ